VASFTSRGTFSPCGAQVALGVFMLFIILVVVFVLALGGGGWGHSRYGYVGWSPAGLLLVLLVVLWFTGHLRG
jgi:hypothetical protein